MAMTIKLKWSCPHCGQVIHFKKTWNNGIICSHMRKHVKTGAAFEYKTCLGTFYERTFRLAHTIALFGGWGRVRSYNDPEEAGDAVVAFVVDRRRLVFPTDTVALRLYIEQKFYT